MTKMGHIFQTKHNEGADLGAQTSNDNQPIIKTAVFAVAGFGTRALPFRPKNAAMIGEKSAIEYAIQEAYEVGVENFVMICSKQDVQKFRDIFEPDAALMDELRKKGFDEQLCYLEHLQSVGEKITYVEQDEMLGLGHAISLTEEHVVGNGGDSFIVLLPDDVFLTPEIEPKCTQELVVNYQGGISIASMQVSDEEVGRYGIADVQNGQIVRLVEKPDLKDAPSRTAVLGRYALPVTETFDALNRIERGAGGELQLTDAIDIMIQEGVAAKTVDLPAHVKRYDCGTKDGIIDTNAEVCELLKQHRASIDQAVKYDVAAPAQKAPGAHRI